MHNKACLWRGILRSEGLWFIIKELEHKESTKDTNSVGQLWFHERGAAAEEGKMTSERHLWQNMRWGGGNCLWKRTWEWQVASNLEMGIFGGMPVALGRVVATHLSTLCLSFFSPESAFIIISIQHLSLCVYLGWGGHLNGVCNDLVIFSIRKGGIKGSLSLWRARARGTSLGAL